MRETIWQLALRRSTCCGMAQTWCGPHSGCLPSRSHSLMRRKTTANPTAAVCRCIEPEDALIETQALSGALFMETRQLGSFADHKREELLFGRGPARHGCRFRPLRGERPKLGVSWRA